MNPTPLLLILHEEHEPDTSLLILHVEHEPDTSALNPTWRT